MGNSKPIARYDLNNPSDLNQLNVKISDPSRSPKISDEYTVYEKGKCAVVEYKSSSIHKAVKQLESSVKLLTKAGNPVDQGFQNRFTFS